MRKVAALALAMTLGVACRTTEPALEPADAATSETANETSVQPDAAIDAPDTGGGPIWPNEISKANSDPWIVEHHDEIRQMQPRVLVLNFVNAKPNAEATKLVERIFAGLREGSRYRGYLPERETTPPFLDYRIGKVVDLRDASPPPDFKFRNSTLYPRRPDPTGFQWGFDYKQLFSKDFAARYAYVDPSDPTKTLDLCGIVDAGLAHEVWIVADADVPDAGAAEVLEWMNRYDREGRLIPGTGDKCAGNGCFDVDVPHCARSLRIGFVNHTRGPGCYLESLSHGMESMATGPVAYLRQYFPHFAGFDLDKAHGTSFKSWYSCAKENCVTFSSPSAVTYDVDGATGTIDPYVPICGNAHFPPNARQHYDVVNPFEVVSTCETYRRGDAPTPFSAKKFERYRALADDCTGPWLVWWRQNWPGLDNGLKDDDGKPMKNWYPYLFY